VIGPISEEQILATAFPLDAPGLRDEFNNYLRSLKASGAYQQLVDKHYPGIKRYFSEFFVATN
jgi:ABC-type amino acid transport substrate-binding protein